MRKSKSTYPRGLKRAMAMLLTLVMFLAFVPELPFLSEPAAAAPLLDLDEATRWYYGTIEGTAAHTFYINTAEELWGLAQLVNNPPLTPPNNPALLGFQNRTIEIRSNIYLGDIEEWEPIGTQRPFNGYFKGNGFGIFDMTIFPQSGTMTNHVGLFGVIGNDAIVDSIRLVDPHINVTVTTALGVGGIAGRNDGVILYCSVIASNITTTSTYSLVSATDAQGVGGISGINNGFISECYNEAAITALGTPVVNGGTGGISGANWLKANIENCYNIGRITSTNRNAGGIIGINLDGGLINRVYNLGEVSVSLSGLVGAISGLNDGSINRAAYWSSSIDQYENQGVISVSDRRGSGGGDGSGNGIHNLTQAQIQDSTQFEYFDIFDPVTNPNDESIWVKDGGSPKLRRALGIDLSPTPITTASILITPPAVWGGLGATPDYDPTSIENSFTWESPSWSPTGGFENNTPYTFTVTLRAKEPWFTFRAGATHTLTQAKVNNNNASIILNDNGTVSISYQFALLTNRIRVTTEPYNLHFTQRITADGLIIDQGELIVNAERMTGSDASELTYRWFYNQTNSYASATALDITANPSAGTRTLNTPNNLGPGHHFFFCEVSDPNASALSDPVLSRIAVVTVFPPPPVTSMLLNPSFWNFGSVLYKYGEPHGPNEPPNPPRPEDRVVRITNTGTVGTSVINIRLEDDDDNNFEVFTANGTTIGNIPPGGTNSFTVRPRPSLSVGIYTATVVVHRDGPGGGALLETFSVSFEVIPAAERTPNPQIDFENERLINLESGVFSLKNENGDLGTRSSIQDDGVGVWIDIEESWMGSTIEIIKERGSSDMFDSLPSTIEIPARRAGPDVRGVMPELIGGDGSIATTTSAMDYRLATDTSVWARCSDGSTSVSPGEYEVTLRHTNSDFRSSITSVTVPEKTGTPAATPTAVINYSDETLTGLVPPAGFPGSNRYIIRIDDADTGDIVFGAPSGGVVSEAGVIAIQETWMGRDLYIVRIGDGYVYGNSEAQRLPIPARPIAPSGPFTASSPTYISGSNATITGITDTMEYRRTDISVWTHGTSTGLATGLTAGDYLIRLRATNSDFASHNATVTVLSYPDSPENTPTITINYVDELLVGFTETYSNDHSKQTTYTISVGSPASLPPTTVIGVTEVKIDESWIGNTIYIVLKGDEVLTTDSVAQVLFIPPRPASPSVSAATPTSIDEIDGKIIGTDLTMEYRDDSWVADRWEKADDGETVVGASGVYLVRYAASPTSFKSTPTSVTVPEWEAPRISDDPPQAQVNFAAETLTIRTTIGTVSSFSIVILDGTNILHTGTYTSLVNEDEIVIHLPTEFGPDEDWMRKMFIITQLGDGILWANSPPLEFQMPGRRATPSGLVQRPPSSPGGSDGTFDNEGAAYPVEIFDTRVSDWVRLSTFFGPAGRYELRSAAIQESDTTGWFCSLIIERDIFDDNSVTKEPVTFSAVQVGGSENSGTTNAIVVTFDRSVSGLTAELISVATGTSIPRGAVTIGALTSPPNGTGTTWTIAITEVIDAGNVILNIADMPAFSVTNKDLPVRVYKDQQNRSVTVGNQSGVLRASQGGTVTFNVTAAGMATPSGIVLTNVSTITGITLVTATTTGINTTMTIRTSNFTPQGVHPLYITIDGVRSNTFYLVVSPPPGTTDPPSPPPPTPGTYTVTVTGSHSATSGAGRYNEGETLTIQAGMRDGYRFNGWTASAGVYITDVDSPTTTMLMPARNVTVTANWAVLTGNGTVPNENVTFTATQVGGVRDTVSSSGINIIFSQSVTGLSAGHITIASSSGSAVRGALSGSGNSYVIALSEVTAQGTLNVSIANFGSFTVSNNPQQVEVFKDIFTRRVTVGSQNGTLNVGSWGTVSFNIATENVWFGASIWLDNINSVEGVFLETANTTGSNTTVRIQTSETTPQGSHPMRLQIDGVTSNIFYLVVGSGGSGGSGGSATRYSVTVNGSYASQTGAGNYAPGDVVTIRAGSSGSFVFDGWSFTGGISIANASNATTTFVMPRYNVTVSANWRAPGTSSGAAGSSEWARSQIEMAISVGLVPSSVQGNYTQAITRAEFCALVVRLYENLTGQVITERVRFNDTNDVNVQKAAAIGVVQGVGSNRFNPDGRLTREQAAVILARLSSELGRPLPTSESSFSDQYLISSWAREAVGQVHAAGIMSGVGDNTFAPRNQITREQSIITILRIYSGS